ncbi:hypothetical protein GCM10023335_28320 [Streptomyces siamensis]|uniref:Uncharacterized protein n=1 Tax=Streptomyces siamensis TaxID=1274986 RepID=A0ABP9ITB2_9ACTN
MALRGRAPEGAEGLGADVTAAEARRKKGMLTRAAADARPWRTQVKPT